jgi:hypothetical protein
MSTTENIIKVCVDKIRKPEKTTKLYQMPAEELTRATGPQRIAAIRANLWRPVGKELRVRFLNGDPNIQAKVQQYASEWMNHANIKLKFVPDRDAEIRVAFKWDGDRGSWSYIGNDAEDIPSDEPTMNYGWLTANTDEDEYSRVILHEFGHCLGFPHEHQHPENGIDWDRDAVYAYYMGPPNNWSRQDVDSNVLQRYSKTITVFTKFDPKSIMLYEIPPEHTISRTGIPNRNTQLSESDKKFARQGPPDEVYPFS